MRVGDTIISLLIIYFAASFTLGCRKQIKYAVYILLLLTIVYILISMCMGYREFYRPARYDNTKKERIVVSLSTLPSRLGGIRPTIESILGGTVQPDVIYLNLPDYSKREKTQYQVTPELLNISPKLKINKTSDDYGPVTKLYPSLEQETDPDTIIICIDDDIKYDPRLIETLVKSSQRYPDKTICLKGWKYLNAGGIINIPFYFPYLFVRSVDVLQCYGGVLYKRKFFGDLSVFKKYMDLKPCFTTDDIMISKYLRKNGVDIYLIPEILKNKELKSQKKSALSDFNTDNNQWIKCINAEIKE